MYKQIFVIVILLMLSICFYILTLKDNSKIIKIPEIVIHKKSIEFKITKSQNSKIQFKGIFVDKNSSQEIMESLNGYKIRGDIKIDKNRETNRDIILFIKKILKKLDDSFLEWSILYKDRKLLISGKTTNIESKNSIDILINFSSLNCFSDIELIRREDNPSKIISNLKSIVEDNEIESLNSTTPTDDEIEDIILALKRLKPEKFIKNRVIKKEIQKSKREMKRRIIKKEKIPKKIIKKEINIEPAYQIPISYDEYKTLPDIQPIDNIEEFNRRLMNNKKPIIDEGTIYLDR